STQDRLRFRTALVASAAVLVVLWALPVYEQLNREPGNLATVARFFAADHDSRHPVQEIVFSVSQELSRLPLFVRTVLGSGTGTASAASVALLTGLQFALAALALGVAAKRHDRFATALCAVALTQAPLAYWVTTKIQGPVYGFLVLWITVPGLLTWCGLGAS